MNSSVNQNQCADDRTTLSIRSVTFDYGNGQGLSNIDFNVSRGQIFGLLGPNGGGKSTLFGLLSTLLPLQSGSISIVGLDVVKQRRWIRQKIGVTFQSPSLDDRLTVVENLKIQSYLYGISRTDASTRIDELLTQFGLADRRHQFVETLSGGLKRRVEIAKCLLHQPEVLLLDEPSTGLDPGARIELWSYLKSVRKKHATTILVSTHLMDEANECDRLAILDRGRIVAIGSPEELRNSIGGDCLTIHSKDVDDLAQKVKDRFGKDCQRVGSSLRIEEVSGHELLRELVVAFPNEIESISLAKPTLEDVFVARTGHGFWDVVAEAR